MKLDDSWWFLTRARLLAVMLCASCGGTVATPMVQVPLFRRAGEGEAGLVVGPGSRRPELGGTVRYAATDTLRVGASVSGAGGDTGGAAPRDQAPRLYADGFVGAEWGGLVFRFGALAGSGYGERSAATDCRGSSGSSGVETPCTLTPRPGAGSQFVRSYGQLHLAFAPPGPLAASLAVRVPVIVELPHDGVERTSALDSEVALTQTIRLPHLRLDLQPLWSHTRGFAFHLALLFRFSTDSYD